MAQEGEEDTGAAGIDEEMVEVGSIEFAMAAVIAEAEALDPATLEEMRRRMDWLKWDLVMIRLRCLYGLNNHTTNTTV